MLNKNIITNKYYKDGIEITAEEYAVILEEIKAKAELVNGICAGTASINDVPSEWREEVQRRVDERIQSYNEQNDESISSDELQSMIEEVL